MFAFSFIKSSSLHTTHTSVTFICCVFISVSVDTLNRNSIINILKAYYYWLRAFLKNRPIYAEFNKS